MRKLKILSMLVITCVTFVFVGLFSSCTLLNNDEMMVVSSEYHTMFLDSNGNIWSWGMSALTGHGYTETFTGSQEKQDTVDIITANPRRLRHGRNGVRLPKFKAISAGGLFSMALDVNGDVWTWGAGEHYRWNEIPPLGHGGKEWESRPRKIEGVSGFNNITAISAGWGHSLAVDENGDIWSWGENGAFLGLGFIASQENWNFPRKITQFNSNTWYEPEPEPKFKEVSADWPHSMALDTQGNIWLWGYASNGFPVDSSVTITSLNHPIMVISSDSFVSIGTGRESNMAIDEQGQVWSWGCGRFGQLGHGGTDDECSPRRIVF
jgi:alpha-tubulin suppressor-like RCC1 family protein